MRFDPDKFARLSSELNNALTQLDRLARMSETEFFGDPDKLASAKYYFLLGIQAAIDICLHLISMNQLAAPADYADAFQIVGEAAVIGDDYIAKLKKAARFRNRLAHLYWDVDDNELRRILNENLTDLKEFLPMLSDLLG